MPEVGHNANANRAVTAYHLSQLMKRQDEKASQDGKYSSYLSRLQAKDMDIAAAKEAIRIHKSGDASEKVEYLKSLAFYLSVLGTPLESDQADLFAKPTAEQTPEEKAREQGFGAGLLGLAMTENPHGAETDLGQVWLTAWHDGQGERGKVAEQERAEEEAEPEDEGDQSDIEDETQDAA